MILQSYLPPAILRGIPILTTLSRQPCSQKKICRLGWLKKGQTSKPKEWLSAKRKLIQREDKAILKPSLITSRDGRDTAPTWKDKAHGFIKHNFSSFLSYNAMTLVWEIIDEKQQEKKKHRRLSPKQEKKDEEVNIMVTWSREHSKFGVSSMCWRSRPGVQTKILSRFTCSFSVSISLRPPIRRPALKLWRFPTVFNTSKSWPANSRVGDIMMLPTPSSGPHVSLYNFSRT